MTHLALVPGLHFAAVLLVDGLVLRADLIDGLSQVRLRSRVHLHVYAAAGHLSAPSRQFLHEKEKIPTAPLYSDFIASGSDRTATSQLASTILSYC